MFKIQMEPLDLIIHRNFYFGLLLHQDREMIGVLLSDQQKVKNLF